MLRAVQQRRLKAWFGLLLSEKGRWASKHKAEKRAVVRMEFKPFVKRVYPRPRPDRLPGKKNYLPPARVEPLATGFSSWLRPACDKDAMLK